MKVLAGLVLLVLALSACSTATIDVVGTDGSTCKGTYTSLFKDTTSSDIGACGASGKAKNSTSNTDLLKSMFEFAAGVK